MLGGSMHGGVGMILGDGLIAGLLRISAATVTQSESTFEFCTALGTKSP